MVFEANGLYTIMNTLIRLLLLFFFFLEKGHFSGRIMKWLVHTTKLAINNARTLRDDSTFCFGAPPPPPPFFNHYPNFKSSPSMIFLFQGNGAVNLF